MIITKNFQKSNVYFVFSITIIILLGLYCLLLSQIVVKKNRLVENTMGEYSKMKKQNSVLCNYNMFFAGLSLKGTKVEKNDMLLDIYKIVEGKVKLVMFYQYSGCNPCIEKTIDAIKKSNFSEDEIIILADFMSSREFRIDADTRGLNDRIYKINYKLSVKDEVKDFPVFIGLIDGDLLIKHPYTIDKSDYENTIEVLKRLYMYSKNYYLFE